MFNIILCKSTYIKAQAPVSETDKIDPRNNFQNLHFHFKLSTFIN